MNRDIKLFKWLIILIVIPIGVSIFGGDRFRYPCQDPANWDSPKCQKPLCDVTRTCPEHVYKGHRDPRLGSPKEDYNTQQIIRPNTEGVNCAK